MNSVGRKPHWVAGRHRRPVLDRIAALYYRERSMGKIFRASRRGSQDARPIHLAHTALAEHPDDREPSEYLAPRHGITRVLEPAYP